MNDERWTVIEPPTRRPALDLGEVWRYRDLLYMLVWRDISARYRQSVVGFGWAIIKPVISMLIFTIIFGKIAKLGPESIPYPIWSYAGLLPWMYFAGCLGGSSQSVVGEGSLLRKVYFPRLILPLSSVVLGLVDFSIQLSVLALLMIWFHVVPTWNIALVPVFLLLSMMTALSVGLWLTALNVKYRDVGQIVPFLTQAWMWLSPVVYVSSKIPPEWRIVYGLNPMVGVIEGFRWAVLGQEAPQWSMMAVSFGMVLVLLVGGLYYFRKTEATFADII